MVTAKLPIELPEGDGRILLEVRSLDDWLWIDAVRSLELPLPDHRRLQEAWVSCLYVPTKRDLDLRKIVAVTRGRSGGNRRRWLAVDGDTDLGKTDLVINMAIEDSAFEQGRARLRENHRLHLPVLFVQADPKMDGLGLLKAICRFGHLPTDGGIPEIAERLGAELPRMGTSLIIIDDAHMLRRTSSKATTLSDGLRVLLRLPVTYVYVGAGLSTSALLKGGIGAGFESAAQTRTRNITWPLSSLRLPRDQAVHDDMIRKFAGRVKAAIPGMSFSGLTKSSVRDKIHKQCEGKHAKIYCLLKDATLLAPDFGSNDVTADLLELLWDQVPGEPYVINPDDWPDDLAVSNAG